MKKRKNQDAKIFQTNLPNEKHERIPQIVQVEIQGVKISRDNEF